ncbi:MAG: hypothetical protein AAF984_11215 [Verrucomicrobiota bacterium]
MEPPKWTDGWERQWGGWAVPHIVRVLVAFNILTYLLIKVDPSLEFDQTLSLIPSKLLEGEIWRLVTFLLVPNTSGGSFEGIFFFIFCWFMWFIGGALHEAWGDFRLNLYFVISIVAIAVVCFLLYGGVVGPMPSFILLTSLIIAFGTIYPNYELMLIPIPFPIKAKWLAIIDAGLIILTCVNSPGLIPFALASLTGYFVFILPGFYEKWKLREDSKRRMRRFRGEDDE